MSESEIVYGSAVDGWGKEGFRRLWRDFLRHEYNFYKGAAPVVLPSRHNLSLFLKYFDLYTTASPSGVVMFARKGEDFVGCRLAGDTGSPFDFDVGNVATVWGTYVAPAYRGLGIGAELVRHTNTRLRELGFDYVLTTASPQNDASIATLKAAGGTITAEVCSGGWDLRENIKDE